MEMTQADYDERKKRWNDGVATDEDRRLCKQYERAGYIESRLSVDPGDTPPGDDPTEDDPGDDVPPLARPAVNAKKDVWVAFAVAFNSRCTEGDEPIPTPTDDTVTKEDLVKAYGHLGEPQS